MKCIIDGCERPSRNSKKPGPCGMHSARQLLRGEPGPPESERPRIPVVQKLLERRQITPAGCWEWTRGRNTLGYGLVHDGDRSRLAHRIAYQHLVGPIPEGMVLDHLCRNPACINPAHLEPVPQRENTLRGERSALRDWPTHCHNGHTYDEANTYWYRGQRRCRGCAAIRNVRYRARQKAGLVGSTAGSTNGEGA